MQWKNDLTGRLPFLRLPFDFRSTHALCCCFSVCVCGKIYDFPSDFENLVASFGLFHWGFRLLSSPFAWHFTFGVCVRRLPFAVRLFIFRILFSQPFFSLWLLTNIFAWALVCHRQRQRNIAQEYPFPFPVILQSRMPRMRPQRTWKPNTFFGTALWYVVAYTLFFRIEVEFRKEKGLFCGLELEMVAQDTNLWDTKPLETL